VLFNDLIFAILLTAYNAFIIFYVSRRVSERFGTYMARKSIHLLSAGVSILLAPFVFTDWQMPLVLGTLMVAFTVSGHLRKPFKWFQIRHNFADIYFTVACTALLVGFWYIDSGWVWVGILSALFLAWGDGLTGIVRNIVYKKRSKGIWGNIAMLLVCLIISFFMNGRVGWAGLIGAVFASVVEKFERIDDNISIPFGSAILMTILRLFALALV
jgi:dolichol kinase